MSSRSSSRSSRSRGSNPRGIVNWDEMSTGMQPDFSDLSAIGSDTSSSRRSGSQRRSSSGSQRRSSSGSQRRLSSADLDRHLRQEDWLLSQEHDNGVRVCYTGTFLTSGNPSKRTTATYTIKQFLDISTKKFNEPGPEPMPQPEDGSEYRTRQDFKNLLEWLQDAGTFGSVDTSLCSDKKHGDPSQGLPSCKECEDYMKDNAGPDLYTAQAREDARARSSRRRARRSRRRREAESIRRARSSARRGRTGAREELVRLLTRRENRRAHRATRRRS